MSVTVEWFRNMFRKWNEAFESNRLEYCLGKTKVLISVDTTKDVLSMNMW